MAFKLLLNNKTLNFKESDLPCLIDYKEKSGGSHFSVTLISNLFLQGSKLLILTAFPMAKNNFMDQIVGSETRVKFVKDKNDLKEAEKFQTVIIESGNGELFLEALKSLNDIDKRILFVKNVEFFKPKLIETILLRNKIILSGDFYKCKCKIKILAKEFKTIIAFSRPIKNIQIDFSKLEKYSGYLKSKHQEGVIKVDMG
jgi:hypothetical protein